MSAVTGDMADIGKQYGTPPSAFWIAEIAAGSQAGTIIGCVGLGMYFIALRSFLSAANEYCTIPRLLN